MANRNTPPEWPGDDGRWDSRPHPTTDRYRARPTHAAARPALGGSGRRRRTSTRWPACRTIYDDDEDEDGTGQGPAAGAARARRRGRAGRRRRRAQLHLAGPGPDRQAARRRRRQHHRRPAQQRDLQLAGAAAAEHGAHVHRAERVLHGLAGRQRARARTRRRSGKAFSVAERRRGQHEGDRQDRPRQGPDPAPGQPRHLRPDAEGARDISRLGIDALDRAPSWSRRRSRRPRAS